jgi:hypothetical protein
LNSASPTVSPSSCLHQHRIGKTLRRPASHPAPALKNDPADTAPAPATACRAGPIRRARQSSGRESNARHP